MNKVYHYTISRTDRIYLISFVVVLLGWELIKEFLPSGERLFTYISPPSEHKGFKEKKDFTYSPHYTKRKYNYSQPRNFEKQYSSYQEEQEQSPPFVPISIMTASIDELTSTGLSRKVAYNIQKFISAGGIIRNEKEFLKIYGMDSLQLNNASPYIIYGASLPIEKDLPDVKQEYVSKGTLKIIDLNQASLEDLVSLNGIGTFSAEKILKFRNTIGGFITTDQLNDCYCLYPDTFEKIKDQLTVSSPPDPIHINQVNLDSLNNPYLTKKMVRLIKAYKNQHGSFADATQFRKVYPPDSNWCNKILPYISFEIKD